MSPLRLFRSATNSFASFAGTFGLTTSTTGV
jgi:hypothetical protein